MTDTSLESTLRWLKEARAYRSVHSNDPRRKAVEWLASEGKAEWLDKSRSDRVRAVKVESSR